MALAPVQSLRLKIWRQKRPLCSRTECLGGKLQWDHWSRSTLTIDPWALIQTQIWCIRTRVLHHGAALLRNIGLVVPLAPLQLQGDQKPHVFWLMDCHSEQGNICMLEDKLRKWFPQWWKWHGDAPDLWEQLSSPTPQALLPGPLDPRAVEQGWAKRRFLPCRSFLS